MAGESPHLVYRRSAISRNTHVPARSAKLQSRRRMGAIIWCDPVLLLFFFFFLHLVVDQPLICYDISKQTCQSCRCAWPPSSDQLALSALHALTLFLHVVQMSSAGSACSSSEAMIISRRASAKASRTGLPTGPSTQHATAQSQQCL